MCIRDRWSNNAENKKRIEEANKNNAEKYVLARTWIYGYLTNNWFLAIGLGACFDLWRKSNTIALVLRRGLPTRRLRLVDWSQLTQKCCRQFWLTLIRIMPKKKPNKFLKINGKVVTLPKKALGNGSKNPVFPNGKNPDVNLLNKGRLQKNLLKIF